MTKFLLLPRRIGLEADLPLKVEVPASIEKVYKEKYTGKLVVWFDTDTDECSCIYLNRSVTANLSSLKYISVYEQKPAKGWGHVGSTLKSVEGEVIATLFASRHSEQSLKWLKATQEKIASFSILKLNTKITVMMLNKFAKFAAFVSLTARDVAKTRSPLQRR